MSDTCDGCDFYTYIGEGDFICIKDDDPELVIEDWIAVREPCDDGSWGDDCD